MLQHIIINILKKYEISINNCRGQAQDGPNAMSSDIKCAQFYIKKLNRKLHTLIAEITC